MSTRTLSEPELVDTREAARRLGISARTLWSLTATGELSAVRIGRAVRYRPETLRQFAARMEANNDAK
jgi:excisionase family DNA binding protein